MAPRMLPFSSGIDGNGTAQGSPRWSITLPRPSSCRIWRAHWIPASASACAWTWSRRCSDDSAQRRWSTNTVTATAAASADSSIARMIATPCCPRRRRIGGIS
jgi:hypothetical protein